MKNESGKVDVKVRSASDVMKEGMKNLAASNVIVERVVSQSQFRGTSDYSYCPMCAKRMRGSFGHDWKVHMKPLWKMRYKVLLRYSETEGRIAFETRWFCPECKRNVSEDDFIREYCPKKEAMETIVNLSKIDLSDPYLAVNF